MASGVEVVVHTRDAACLAPEEQAGAHEAGRMLEQAGIAVVGHSALQQRYGILDERVVWYGNADLLAFGRRDASMLRFKNADVAGELLDLVQEAGGEQLRIEEGI